MALRCASAEKAVLCRLLFAGVTSELHLPNRLFTVLHSTLKNELHLTAHQLSWQNNALLANEVQEYHRIYTGLLHAQRQTLRHLRSPKEYDGGDLSRAVEQENGAMHK